MTFVISLGGFSICYMQCQWGCNTEGSRAMSSQNGRRLSAYNMTNSVLHFLVEELQLYMTP